MLADARAVPDGGTLNCDVCVVGAGPMGLSFAQEVAGDGLRVCVLESGSSEPVGAGPALEGEVTGESYPPLSETRMRGVGGTANIWIGELARNVLGARYG